MISHELWFSRSFWNDDVLLVEAVEAVEAVEVVEVVDRVGSNLPMDIDIDIETGH